MTVHFPFQNSYSALPDSFFARVAPTPVAAPRLIKLNRPLAVQLGLDPDLLETPEGAEILAGKTVPAGADPIAMAYAGHQFGHFVPQLGDGRAILMGEVVDRDGVRRDIQLKGSGPTPFSRRGDGRAALGPVLREYIVSEAMAALGIPTTRSLAAVMSGEHVMRETPLPGAVLTRVAASHVRVGTFQYFAARGDTDGVVRDPAYSAFSRPLWRCGNAVVPKETLRHVAQPTTHQAIVRQRGVEGALEEESPRIHDEGCPEPHGNGQHDVDEFDAHGLIRCERNARCCGVAHLPRDVFAHAL